MARQRLSPGRPSRTGNMAVLLVVLVGLSAASAVDTPNTNAPADEETEPPGTKPGYDEERRANVADQDQMAAHAGNSVRKWTLAPPHRFDTLVTMFSSPGPPCCNGIVIAEDFVLTAAHCATLFDKENFVVNIGGYKTEGIRGGANGRDHIVKNVFIHPRWNESAIMKGYDVALLKLHVPHKGPVSLLAPNTMVSRGNEELLGFNWISPHLHMARMTVVERSFCPNIMGLGYNSQCVYSREATMQDGCSGSPLLVPDYPASNSYWERIERGNTERDLIVGIVSMVNYTSLNKTGYTGVGHTPINEVLDWILEIIDQGNFKVVIRVGPILQIFIMLIAGKYGRANCERAIRCIFTGLCLVATTPVLGRVWSLGLQFEGKFEGKVSIIW